jgi:hypothetical protein
VLPTGLVWTTPERMTKNWRTMPPARMMRAIRPRMGP